MSNVFYVNPFEEFYRMATHRNFLRGRWENTRVWDNQEHLNDFRKYGSIVKPKLHILINPNGITNVGIHYNLDSAFRGVTQLSAWYAGLIDNAGFAGVDPTDTMASHSGWSESTDYSESVRQTLSFGAAASRQITAEVSFTMNATKTIEGIFVNSDSTKGGTTGTLWSTAEYSTAPDLEPGNVLTTNYTLSD